MVRLPFAVGAINADSYVIVDVEEDGSDDHFTTELVFDSLPELREFQSSRSNVRPADSVAFAKH
jgi:hypothetical protein